jgi:pimeloyl-ACP methyl ester carboxylesterase
MPYPEFDYEDLGSERNRIDPSTVPEGEPWTPTDTVPAGFPEKPVDTPPEPNSAPRIFGDEIGLTHSRPLILVPGIGATRLERWRHESRGKLRIDEPWLPYNPSRSTTTPLAHLHDPRKRPVGGANPLLDQSYTGLIRFLEDELYYVLGKNLFIFGYDWTRSNRDSGKRLAAFIDMVITEFAWPVGTPNNAKKVDVLAHSMGGLVTRAAIRLWGAEIRGTVYMASPHYGAVKAYVVLHPSFKLIPWYFDIPLRYKTEFGTGAGGTINDTLKWIAQSTISAYELLPDETYFERNPSIATIFDLLSYSLVAASADYPPPDPGDYNSQVSGLTNTYHIDGETSFTGNSEGFVNLAMQFKSEIGTTLPGEIYFVIASNTEKTVNDTLFTKGIIRSEAKGVTTPHGVSNGDGTVPFTSGRGPGAHVTVSGDHNFVQNSRETFWWISRFLSESG